MIASNVNVSSSTMKVVLGVVMGNELSSIVSNYFEAHGKHINGLNIFKIISDKAGVDLQDVTIENDKDSKTTENEKDNSEN